MLVLGGGITGLTLGYLTGLPVFEANHHAGGICSSYYVRPAGDRAPMPEPPRDQEAYRFEVGGGHWLWSREPSILDFISSFTSVKRYDRNSAVYFPESGRWVPYPIQYHLSSLDPEVAQAALEEILNAGIGPVETMLDWFRSHFGPTLTRLFFEPHNALYTAGLLDKIAPQDAYKSPVDRRAVLRGAMKSSHRAGYNASFVYPKDGLDALVRALASRCEVHYGKVAERIEVSTRRVHFRDGSVVEYDTLISTLPLNQMLVMTGLQVDEEPDPYTSVLVLNIGAKRGKNFPAPHWVYVPQSKSGFHRLGFYSNVDDHFLPRSYRGRASHAAIYVERAFPGGGGKPDDATMERYAQSVIDELHEWGFIEDVEVISRNWVEVGYCWRRPGSQWQSKAIHLLRDHGIYQVGRFALWTTQGIADSMKQAFALADELVSKSATPKPGARRRVFGQPTPESVFGHEA